MTSPNERSEPRGSVDGEFTPDGPGPRSPTQRIPHDEAEWIREKVLELLRLLQEVRQNQSRPPREQVGPSFTYWELEVLLGYPRPTSYRARRPRGK